MLEEAHLDKATSDSYDSESFVFTFTELDGYYKNDTKSSVKRSTWSFWID